MSLLLISIFSFLAAVFADIFMLRMRSRIHTSRIKRRLTTIGRFDQASPSEMPEYLKTDYSESRVMSFVTVKFIHESIRRGRPRDMTQMFFSARRRRRVAFSRAILANRRDVFNFRLIAPPVPPFIFSLSLKRLRILEQFPWLRMIASLQAVGVDQAMVSSQEVGSKA